MGPFMIHVDPTIHPILHASYNLVDHDAQVGVFVAWAGTSNYGLGAARFKLGWDHKIGSI